MSTDTVSLFLALLAVVAEVAVVATVVLAVGRRFSPALARAGDALLADVGPHTLVLGFCVAAVATLGSLYFSEVAHFVPCRLCWYQRICMYPLVPLLGMAAFRRDLGIRLYAGALAGIGALISTYHVLLERFPSLEGGVCEATNPCTIIWVERFGYLTIPAMALSAFALLLALLALPPVKDDADVAVAPDPDADAALAGRR
jgi:disulfide bond formation protein DsbB